MNDPWISAEPGLVHETTVWRIPLALDAAGRRACLAALSDPERARAARFLRAQDRDRYAASHAALRMILAPALDAAPEALRFRETEAGKPELDGTVEGFWRGRLHFNLSHSGDFALIGLSPSARIGVDIEAVRPIADCLTLARLHFAPSEAAALARVPPEALQVAFYACWTRKEAFVKALGLGLSFALDRFAVAIPPEPAALLAIDGAPAAAAGWTLKHLDPAPSHVGAVAIEGASEEAGQRCLLRGLDPGWAAGA